MLNIYSILSSLHNVLSEFFFELSTINNFTFSLQLKKELMTFLISDLLLLYVTIDPVIIPDLSNSSDGLTASHCVKTHHKLCLRLYNDMMKNGVCREQARGVLPQSLYTEYYGTCNLGNLLKFIELRLHEGAQWEIQQVAKACLSIAEDLFPVTVSSYRDIKK